MRLQICVALTACLLAGSLGGCSVGLQESRAAFEPVTAPRQVFVHPRATASAPKYHQPAKARRQIVHRRTKPTRYVTRALLSPAGPVAGSIVVPLPSGAPANSTASVANPLLAPLQSASPPKAVVRTDEMPLPAAAAAAPSPVAPAPTRPASTMPLPN